MKAKPIFTLASIMASSFSIAVAQVQPEGITEVTFETLDTQAAQDLLQQHLSEVGMVLVAGSGPSSNRLDHFYASAYLEGRGALPQFMEHLSPDFNARVNCATGILMDDIDPPELTGGFVNDRPALRNVFKRYAPYFKVWKLDAIDRITTDGWPLYHRDLHRSGALFQAAQQNAGFDWGSNDHHWGVTGAGAGGIWANSKICVTDYTDVGGTSWAWHHEGTHAHHNLAHASGKDMKSKSIDGESGSLSRNYTFGPTGGLWGEWMAYSGIGTNNLSSYSLPLRAERAGGLNKDIKMANIDVEADNAYPSENRVAHMIHTYHHAFDPIDSHTPTGALLENPSHVEVRVASTEVVKIRWYVNGTELPEWRDIEVLNFASLGLSSGRHEITARVYDEVIDYAFTGDPEKDLVRSQLHTFAEVIGWSVNLSSGGSNSYGAMSALDSIGATQLAAGQFTTSPAGKTAVFPWTGATRNLDASGGFSAGAMHFSGSYSISGAGTLTLASGDFSADAHAHASIQNNLTASTGLTKAGLGTVLLGGNNTLGSDTVEISGGMLGALSPTAFGQEPAKVTLRRGAELRLNAGIQLGDSVFEGFSCVWADTGEEVARLGNLDFQTLGDENIGLQQHHYFKLGTGTLAFDGDATLDDSVLILTGDQRKEPDHHIYHWFMDLGRGGTYEINGDISGRGSLVAKHGGLVKLNGNLDLQGESDESDTNNGILAVMYGTHFTVASGATLSTDIVDLHPFSTFEYNGNEPLAATIIPSMMTTDHEREKLNWPGFFGHLCGTGDLSEQVVLRMDASISPGAFQRAGRQNYLGGLVIDNEATYQWDLENATAANDIDGLPTGWDVMKVTGTLDLNGVLPAGLWTKDSNSFSEPADEQVLLKLVIGGSNGLSADDLNLTASGSQTFVIMEADNIIGFSPEKFELEVDNLSPVASAGGEWSIQQNGNRIELVYTNSQNEFITSGGSLVDNENWSSGERPSASMPGYGYVNLPGLINSAVSDLDLVLQAGAVITRSENGIYEWQGDTDIIVDGGSIDYTASSDSGNSARSLRIKGTSSLELNSGSLTTWSNRNLEMFDNGSVIISGGVLDAGGISTNSNFGNQALLTFASGGGTVILRSGTLGLTNGAFVNFLSGSNGSLEVAGKDQAYFEGLWTAGTLRYEGANLGNFADYFEVNGSILSRAVLPSPVLDAATLAIDENQPASSLVGLLSPSSSNGSLNWELVDDAGGLFAIDPTSGEVRTLSSFDFEDQSNYQITAQVSDGSGLSDTASISIQIQNINEAPNLEDAHFTVVENSPPGLLGSLNFDDVDPEDSLTFTIVSGNAAGLFSINSSTGDIASTSALDFESASSHSLNIQATDEGGLTATAVVQITVTDIPEANRFATQGGLVIDPANWSEGTLPTGDEAGIIASDGLIPSTLSAFDLIIESGTITRSENDIYEWTNDTDVVLEGGLIDFTANSPAGNSARVLRLRDTSSLTMAGGNLQLWSNRSLVFFNQSRLVVQDGLLEIGGILTAADFDGGAFLTFDQGNGEVSLAALDVDLSGGGAINYLAGSNGKLSISGADDTYYRSLWTSGSLQVDGQSTGNFDLYFKVTNGSLELRNGDYPAPSLADSALALSENSPIASQLGTLSPDSHIGDLSWSLVDDANGSFAIDSATGAITNLIVADFETQSSYALTVSVSDETGLSDTAQLSISITDENEAPSLDPQSFSIAENSPSSVLGTISLEDPDAGDSFTFAIISGNNGAFAIDPTSGELSTVTELDYETTPLHTLTIEVTDQGGLTASAAVQVSVTDLPEINEFTALGGLITDSSNWSNQMLPTADEAGVIEVDALIPSTLSAFDLVVKSGNITRSETGVYQWVGDTDIILEGGLIDFTANSSSGNTHRVLRLKDTSSLTLDGGTLRLWNDRNLEFFNEGRVIIKAGRLEVGGISSDSSFDGGALLTFDQGNGVAVIASSNLTLNGGGSINFLSGSQGQLTLNGADHSNFQTLWNNGSLKVDGQSTGNFDLFFKVTADTIELRNGVYPSPSIASASFTLVEDAEISSNVGILTTSSHIGDLSWSLIDDANGSFAIDQATGELTSLIVADFETQDSYQLTASVTDETGLSDTELVTVTIVNENEPPNLSDATFTIAENSPATVLGALSVTDPDDNETFNFSIISGNTGAFVIDPSSGVLSTNSELDYEQNASHSLVVEVTDTVGLSSQAPIDVTITNVNEAPSIGSASFTVAENSPATTLGTLSASDPDANDTLAFAIISGNSGAFAIDPSSGALSTTSELDYEETSSHSLTVSVTDAAGLSSTANVSITVTDVQEVFAPTATITGVSQISFDSAQIGVSLSNDGGEPSQIVLYYGTSDGGQSTSAWTSSFAFGAQESSYAGVASLSGLSSETTYYYALLATNSAGETWTTSASFTTERDTSPKLARTTLNDVSSDSWMQVDLGVNYTSAVVIATPVTSSSSEAPVMTRIRNLTGNSFEIKLERVDGSSTPVVRDVSIVSIEEGIYTEAEHGVTMEAVKFTSTLTANQSSWTGESRGYQNSYTAPVVVGQVLSSNDSSPSYFWAAGATANSPASASSLVIAKGSGQDPNPARLDETIGYLVIESGSHTLSGTRLEAGISADIVRGKGNTSTGYTIPLSGAFAPGSVALSCAGNDASDPYWPQLFGPTPSTSTSLTVIAEEDKLSDTEQNHSTEQVAYLIVE